MEKQMIIKIEKGVASTKPVDVAGCHPKKILQQNYVVYKNNDKMLYDNLSYATKKNSYQMEGEINHGR
jgi:hypothetical protein